MDNVCHTLAGAALAESGLARRTALGYATLLIGANLPDIDALMYFHGADAALYARRGWSHGVLAMVLLPLLLTGAIVLWSRWRRKPHDAAPPLRAAPLLAVACLAVWSHPLLDWLNTYGVRLLMPFDRQWFYGDTLFIVDPWLWLLLAAGVVVGRSARAPAIIAWMLLAAAASWLLLSRGLPPGIAIAWFAGLFAVLLLRWRLPPQRAGVVAQAGIAAALAYGALMFGLARDAEARAAERFPGEYRIILPGADLLPLFVLGWPELPESLFRNCVERCGCCDVLRFVFSRYEGVRWR